MIKISIQIFFNICLIKNHIIVIQFKKTTDELDDWQQLLLMSCCEHNIIANSSFSWWGAYLNNNKDRRIIAPQSWFLSRYDDVDLIPYIWERI